MPPVPQALCISVECVLLCIIICLLAVFPTRGPRVRIKCSTNNDWVKTILCLKELAFEATISVSRSGPFVSVEGKETQNILLSSFYTASEMLNSHLQSPCLIRAVTVDHRCFSSPASRKLVQRTEETHSQSHS